jgi:uncharacterized membrane protein YkgB
VRGLVDRIKRADQRLLEFVAHYGHWIHRISLGLLFIWFGLLKPLGHKTTTSILAHTIYFGKPEVTVQVLGWWEVAIGICLLVRPLVRLAVLLLLVRLPGVILAFILKPEVCFFSFPFAPTPEGQYLIKDLVIFIATLAIVGTVHDPAKSSHYH